MNRLSFVLIGEQKYYKRKVGDVIENVFDYNGYRLAYYILDNNVYAYYMGQYYISLLRNNKFTENEIIEFILLGCSDPYKFETIGDDLLD